MDRTERTTDRAGWTAARWAVLCALLLGLFLMHGSPASAAGCHPGRTERSGPGQDASVPSGGVAAVPVHPASVRHRPAARPPHARPGSDRPAVGMPVRDGGPGAVCVSTQARDRPPVPAPGAALPWCPARPVVAVACREGAERGGRAPPDGGRGLLIRVCVARR